MVLLYAHYLASLFKKSLNKSYAAIMRLAKAVKMFHLVTGISSFTCSRLLMPLLCREMVELLDKSDSLVNHTSLSNYAFLYGVFPAAPGVAIFATQFNMEVEVVCLLNTFQLDHILIFKCTDEPHFKIQLFFVCASITGCLCSSERKITVQHGVKHTVQYLVGITRCGI